MVATCLNCNATFKSDYALNRHLTRKNKCLNEEAKLKKNDCIGCGKTFYDLSNRNRHMKKCPNIIGIQVQPDVLRVTNAESQIRILQEENMRIREENLKIREELINSKVNNNISIDNSVTNNNNTVNNNNTIINIKNFYGDLMRDIVNSDFIKKIDNKLNDENNVLDILDLLIKFIHFDKENKEYHNVYATNIRDKKVQIFDEDAWVSGNESDFNMVSCIMIDYVKEFKECYMDILKDNPELKSNKIESNMKNFNVNRKSNRDLDLDILQLMHKYRNIPIDTRKQMGI
jgi:hypothetical protein